VSARRDVVFVMDEYKLSERRACRLLDLDRASYRYDARPDHNEQLREELVTLAKQKPRFGYRRLWAILTRRGWSMDPKRLHRLYREENLAVRRLRRKRVVRPAPTAARVSAPNQEWAIDFVFDSVANGRSIRALTLVDSFTRECPAIEVGTSIASMRVTRALDRVIEMRGRPQSLRCDNGSEFTSRHFLGWCEEKGIQLIHIQPGRPMQNGHVESFNGRFRDECLNANWFQNLVDAKRKIESWRADYNLNRPHSSLAYRTPAEYAKICSELTSGIAAIPPNPPVSVGESHAGARGQGYAAAAPYNGAPLPAPRRRAEKHYRDGRLRRDG
jgi:putative transposase